MVFEKGTTCFIYLHLLKLIDVYSLQIQKRMEEMASAGLDTTSLDDEAFSMEVAQDRCILRLIASCCNGEYLRFLVTSTEDLCFCLLASFLLSII